MLKLPNPWNTIGASGDISGIPEEISKAMSGEIFGKNPEAISEEILIGFFQ